MILRTLGVEGWHRSKRKMGQVPIWVDASTLRFIIVSYGERPYSVRHSGWVDASGT